MAKRGHHLTFCLEDWEVAKFKSKGVLNNQNYTAIINKAYDTPEEGYEIFIGIRDKMAELGSNPFAALKFVLEVQADLCRKFVTNPATSKILRDIEIDMVIADFSNPCAVIIAGKLIIQIIFKSFAVGIFITIMPIIMQI